MADEPKTAGTPPTDDGDAGDSPTTGTPVGDDRDASVNGEPTPEEYKKLFLAQKSEVEEARRLKAEVAELRMRAGQPPADQDDDEPADEDEVDWATVQEYARRGDEVAKAQLANRKNTERLARNVADSLHLRDITDEEERKEVYKHYVRSAKAGRPLPDIKAARAEIRERRLASENAELKKRLEAAQKQPPRDVVSTHSREVPAKEAKDRPKMTFSDFDSQVAELKRQGRYRDAMALQVKLDRDEIEVE